MDDLLSLVFGLFALLLLVGTPVLAIVALVRTSRIGRLENELRHLRQELARLRRTFASDAAEPRTPDPSPAAPKPPPLPRLERTSDARDKVAALTSPGPRSEPSAGATPQAAKRASPRRTAVEWEKWIGVRGAAVLGGIVLAAAAVFFFKHALENNWIKPPVRVAMGVTTGIGLLVAGHFLRRRKFAWVPGAVEGAGIVALYATVWAADKRYSFLSTAASFPLMAVITALACVLSVRHKSLVTAVIGLVGGFATPLLLSSGSDRPLSLFGYLLLLDLGLVFVGRKRRWPSIGALALVGTFLIEGMWITRQMGPDRLWMGLVFLGVFSVLFAVSGGIGPASERRKWLPSQAGAVLFPFVFALYFAGHLDFRGHVYPTALLLGLLTIGAFVVGRMQDVPWLPVGAASACVAVVGVWLLQADFTDVGRVWELAAVVLGLALVPAVAAEWEHRREAGEAAAKRGFAFAATGAAGGWMLLAVITCAITTTAPVGPLLVMLLALALLLVRHAWTTGLVYSIHGAALGLGLGLAVHRALHELDARAPVLDARLHMALLVALGCLMLAAGLAVAGPRGRALLHGVGIFLGLHVLDFATTSFYHAHDPWLLPATALAFALLLAASAGGLRWSVMFGGAVLAPCFLVLRWVVEFRVNEATPDSHLVGLLFVLALAAVGTLWPVVFRARFEGRPTAWRLGALTALLLLYPVGVLYRGRFGEDLPLAPPLLAGLVCLAGLVPLVRRARAGEATRWRTGLAWYGGVTLLLWARVVPEQIGVDEELLAGALWAAGLAWLARRLAHPGLAWLAVTAIAIVTAVLVAYGVADHHYRHAAFPLVNWIGYTNLVPAACALFVLSATQAIPDGLHLHRAFHRARRLVPGIAALVAVFTWLNLEILSFFAQTEWLIHDLDRLPARDVTTSVAWGVFALLLLILGTARRTSALRWSSMGLFFLAIGKVFLHDLGHLEGLYRVGSLAGLAVSLILVSLLYQRFVFRK